MSPITTETMESIQGTITKLENRVHQLEAKLQDAGGDVRTQVPAGNASSIRMILMGPPGAGKSHTQRASTFRTTNWPAGKGTQAPKLKEKYCACHLVYKYHWSAIDSLTQFGRPLVIC